MTAGNPVQSVVNVAVARTPDDWEHAQRLVGELVSWLATTVGFDARAQQHDSNEELDDLADFYALPGGQLLLGSVGGIPCGTTGVHLMSATTAELRRVWVTPQSRGNGLAPQLLTTGIEMARTLGANEVWLETVSGPMDTAIAMYKRSGFVTIPHYSSLHSSVPDVLSLGLKLR